MIRFINKIIFTLREALSGLYRNFYKIFVQFAVSFISLCIFSFILIGYYNLQKIAQDIDKKVEVNIFLDDDITTVQMQAIQSRIINSEKIKTYQLITKETAKENAFELFENNKAIVDTIKDLKNPFPSSFVIELKDASYAKEVAAQFEGMAGISEDGIKYGEEFVDNIVQITAFLRYFSLAMAIFFVVIAVILMGFIIDLVLSTKKREYKIMQLTGASKIQIKAPFYIQGIFLGASSAYISYLVSTYFYASAVQSFTLTADILKFAPVSEFKTELLIYVMSTGVLTGVTATSMSLRRFVKISKAKRKSKRIQAFVLENKKKDKKSVL